MNPLTNVKNIKKLSETELRYNISAKASWHNQYKDSAWIFIGGLPYDLSEGDIICIFSQYGEVVNLNLVRDKVTGKSKGFCFLCYEDQRSTVLAVDNLNSITVLKRILRVDHVQEYKVPKDPDRLGEEELKLIYEGCGPESAIARQPLQVNEVQPKNEAESPSPKRPRKSSPVAVKQEIKSERDDSRWERNDTRSERDDARLEKSNSRSDKGRSERNERIGGKSERTESRSERNGAKFDRNEDRSDRNGDRYDRSGAKSDRTEGRSDRHHDRSDRRSDRSENHDDTSKIRDYRSDARDDRGYRDDRHHRSEKHKRH